MSAANQSSPNWANPNPYPAAGNGPPAAGANTALLHALNPAAARIQFHPHVGLGGGASAPDAHVLGETPQHGYSNHYNNDIGQQLIQRPLDAVEQATLFEQPGLVASGSGTGTSAVAGPTTADGIGERTHSQWTGMLQWRNEMKVARTQVTAIATKGNPCAFFPSGFLLIEN